MATPLDRRTVDRLVVEHLPAVLRLARRLTGELNTAEDVVQQALCQVLRRWRSCRGEESFRPWLMQIVVNVDRDRRRRLRQISDQPAETLPDRRASVHEQTAAAELHEQIRDAMTALPERQREVALLHYGERLTAKEISEVLGITTANVHATLHLARKAIAQALPDEIGATYMS